MNSNKDIVGQIGEVASHALTPKVQQTLTATIHELRNYASMADDRESLIRGEEKILARFRRLFEKQFSALVEFGTDYEEEKAKVRDFANLRLMVDDDLEAVIAMEGMVTYARKRLLEQSLPFVSRLDTLLSKIKIDESNDPLDPQQLGAAFASALQPLSLKSNALLIAYRHFNSQVFKALPTVIDEANKVFIDLGILSELDVSLRQQDPQGAKRESRPPRQDPNERAFSDTDELNNASPPAVSDLNSVIERLLHDRGARSGTQERSELLDAENLLALLDGVQQGSAEAVKSRFEQGLALADWIAAAVGSEPGADTPDRALFRNSDAVMLVELLFDAIWSDESLPAPIKELIVHTEICVLKAALRDTDFFAAAENPVRLLINELATAGISWTETEVIQEDPMYLAVKRLIQRLVGAASEPADSAPALLEEFQQFKQAQNEQVLEDENRFRATHDRNERVEELHIYARNKIQERIIDPKLPAAVKAFLLEKFSRFVVRTLLKEGPGGPSWRPIMTTVDVLLWTVDSERSEADRERFEALKDRLMTNLAKAMKIAGMDEHEAASSLDSLRAIQDSRFQPSTVEDSDEDVDFDSWLSDAKPMVDHHLIELPESDKHLQQVDKLPLGVWMEFQGVEAQSIRCSLAGKIDMIDKYVFVNARGAKVIEKSRMGLARELKDGTVKIISEAPLIDRAIETVIGKLRNSGEPNA